MLQKLIEHNDRNDLTPVCCFAIISPNLYKEKAVENIYVLQIDNKTKRKTDCR